MIALPRLFAFDLDGTLLNDCKQLSCANTRALHEMAATGAALVFASGRTGSAMQGFVRASPAGVSLLTLNGAEVYDGSGRKIRDMPLSSSAAQYLVDYARGREFGCNYYIGGELFAVRSAEAQPWLDLYHNQTGTVYQFKENLSTFRNRSPSKILFVGDKAVIDHEEARFKKHFSPHEVYVCRTWDHYLEFLNPEANKAAGLQVLADTLGVAWDEIAAFGDAENDIPLLQRAGCSIAMANATPEVKLAAKRVSPWTNDEDGVAREWERMKGIGVTFPRFGL